MREQYLNLLTVLANVGFSREEIKSLEQILVAILHVGNVEFNEASNSYAELTERHTVAIGTSAEACHCSSLVFSRLTFIIPCLGLSVVARLLGIALDKVTMMMVSTYSITRGERLYKNFDLFGAEDNRDALAKVGRSRARSRLKVGQDVCSPPFSPPSPP